MTTNNLDKFLSQATQIATQSRLNIDEIPTSFTVLDRQMIERTGAVTVADLLRFVPGVEVIREGNGSYHVLIRGNYSDRRVLILWDGEPLNVLLTRRALQFIGFLPVDVLERIEISRGPSSSVYGSYAVGGVINLVPRKWNRGGELGGAYGTYTSYRGFTGAGFHEKDLSLQFSVGAFSSKGAQFTVLDAVGKPGPLKFNTKNNWQETRLQWKGLRASFFRFSVWQPYYYEISDRLSRRPDPKPHMEYLGARLSYDFKLAPTVQSRAYLGWRQDTIDYGVVYVLNPDDPVFQMLGLPQGSPYGAPILAQEDNHLREISYGFWTSWHLKGHNLKWGLEWMKNAILSSSFSSNINLAKLANPSLASPLVFPTLVQQHDPWPRVSERMWAVYFQDEWQIDSKNEINVGLRFDKYKGFRGECSPRLVWIHRFSAQIITKLIYGHGFRVPDLDALYDDHYPFIAGNPNLKPERLDSIETVLIYKPTNRQRFSISLFRMWLADVLGRRVPGGIGGWSFQQGKHEDVWGGEVSWRYQGDRWDFYLFGSYQWSKNEFGEPRPYVANVLAGGVTSYSFQHLPLEISLAFNYVGPRWREKYNLSRSDPFSLTSAGIYLPDTRPKLKSYHFFNLKFQYEMHPRVTIWLEATNLFNNDIRYPSTYINGIGIKNDYREQRRYLEIGLRLRF